MSAHGVKVIPLATAAARHPQRFSLVVATLGRVELLERFLFSVVAQNYPNVEVLIADQNDDDRLAGVIKSLGSLLEIKHLRAPRGISRARNFALPHVTGDIIAFPDDDCFFSAGLLHRVATKLHESVSVAGFVGSLVEEGTLRRFRGFSGREQPINARNVWLLSSSVGLFLRADVVRSVGDFDETLGLGSGTPWGAAEDRDYPLRALDRGFNLQYDPTLEIQHPPLNYNNCERARSYGGGLGRVLRKRGAGPIQAVRFVLLRPIGGMILSLLRGELSAIRFYYDSMLGRISGWRAPL